VSPQALVRTIRSGLAPSARRTSSILYLRPPQEERLVNPTYSKRCCRASQTPTSLLFCAAAQDTTPTTRMILKTTGTYRLATRAREEKGTRNISACEGHPSLPCVERFEITSQMIKNDDGSTHSLLPSNEASRQAKTDDYSPMFPYR